MRTSILLLVVLLAGCLPLAGCDLWENALDQWCPQCDPCGTADYACWYDDQGGFQCDLPWLNGDE